MLRRGHRLGSTAADYGMQGGQSLALSRRRSRTTTTNLSVAGVLLSVILLLTRLALCTANMGNSQSKPPSEHALQKELTKRVRELELERTSLPPVQEKSLLVPEKSSAPNVMIDATEQWQQELVADPKNRLAIRAFEKNTPEELLKSRATSISDTQIFNIKLALEGSPVTDQKSSGRCWLFATTNVFRIALMKKYNLDKFELSQCTVPSSRFRVSQC